VQVHLDVTDIDRYSVELRSSGYNLIGRKSKQKLGLKWVFRPKFQLNCFLYKGLLNVDLYSAVDQHSLSSQ
jgi:hypothetical protein